MISIVIPVYNAIDTLGEAFQSVLTSGVLDLEIIMVDDGSNDGSWEAICDYQQTHPNVVAIRHERNRGGGAARNTGVRAAKYQLIFVLDSDDVLTGDHALQRAIKRMENGKLDGVAPGVSIFFKGNVDNITNTEAHKLGIWGFGDLILCRSVNFDGNFVYRKSAFESVGGYPEHHSLDTTAFSFRMLGNNKKILVTDEPIYCRRLPDRPSYYIREAREGNISRNWFYIFLESLYKFKPEFRNLILQYNYSDPILIAKGQTISKLLFDHSKVSDIFCDQGLKHNDTSAFQAYHSSSDVTLQIWCMAFDLRRGDLNMALERMEYLGEHPEAKRTLYPLLALWFGDRLDTETLEEFRYFFGEKKSANWWARRTFQRVRNGLERLFNTSNSGQNER